MYEIKIENVTSAYKNKKVLSNLYLYINNLKYNFIIGDNGIGKSTLIKCIKNIFYYEGKINNNEYDIAYVPEKVNYPDFISVYNFLMILGKANNISAQSLKSLINYYLEVFGMMKYRNTPLIKLSLGTKQKISIIQALVQDKGVYIFDEPLNGLDIESQNVFIEELIKLKKREKLILIITHQLNKYPFDDVNIINLNEYV